MEIVGVGRSGYKTDNRKRSSVEIGFSPVWQASCEFEGQGRAASTEAGPERFVRFAWLGVLLSDIGFGDDVVCEIQGCGSRGDEPVILTLTPNPSLDLTYELDELVRGEVQRADSMTVEAGGKGINVTRNLIANGAASQAVAPIGGPSGEQFVSLIEGVDIELIQVPVDGAVRMNVSLAEQDGTGTKVNAPGSRLSEDELDRMLGKTAEAARNATWVAVCGSLPPNAPEDLYARVVALAREAECRTAVDSSGPPLAATLEEGPDLIKPNLEELSELVGRELTTLGDALEAAKEVRARGVGTVLVSLGADGAILLDEEGALHADTPPFTPRSTVGAGDSLLAGFLFAAGDREAALVEAVAWGAAATRLPGSRGPAPGDLDREAVSLHEEFDMERKLKGEAPR
ncbi:MAG: 1-phosphofructokinase [Rubrobacteraceae bacterium]